MGTSGWKETGQELMGKVKKQPLTQFLNSQLYRDRGKKNHNVLGIPPIDSLINEVLNPVLTNTGNLPKRLRLPVIEISSRGSQGKTQLLYYICAVSTLPTWLNGKGSAVVVIDCPGKFDVDRLYVVMKGYCERQRELTTEVPLANRQLDLIITEALKHVHLFQPEDSGQLLETIKNIKPYLHGETEHHHLSAQKKVDCIMVDGISRFIWEDRFHDYGAVMVDEDHPDWINIRDRYNQITNELRVVATNLCCFIVVTNMGIMRSYDPDRAPTFQSLGEKTIQYRPRKKYSAQNYHDLSKEKLPFRPPRFDRPYLKHILPQQWTPFVNMKIVVQRVDVPRFAKGISLKKALGNREKRVAVVQQGRFVGFADTIGLGGGVQSAVQTASGGTGGFYFHITNDGVDVTAGDVSGPGINLAS